MKRRSLRTGLMLGALAAGLMLTLATEVEGQPRPNPTPTFDAARTKYEADLRRPSLFIRTRSAERLAATQDPRAWDLLVARYQRPPDQPHDHVKYTTATMLGHFFRDAAHLQRWDRFLNSNSNDFDSWLWFHGQRVRASAGNHEGVMAQIRSTRNDYLRAASIEGLARAGRKEVLGMFRELLENPRQRGLSRVLLLEACAAALSHLEHEMATAEFKEAALLLLNHFNVRGTDQRTTLVIARHLKKIYREPEAWSDAVDWRRVIDRGTANPAAGLGGHTRVQFMNVPAIGERIVFVIDLSDSMMAPLNEREREELRGPTSGGQGPGAGPNDGLPWDQIRNRFDLAREALKQSLRGLPDSLFFAVVMFGTDVETLRTTPALIQARPAAIRSVISELDAIRPGPPGQGRPHGTLKGNTNMHGAIMRAFQLTNRAPIQGQEHINSSGFEHGADTIFLLSDGSPSTDDFVAEDARDPEDMAGDPEMGTLGDQSATRLIYYGPYVTPGHEIHHLLADIARMNLHRKVEIHCIGIGEADQGLLNAISQIGMGTTRFIGSGQGGPGR